MKILIAGQYSAFVDQLISKFNKENWDVFYLTGTEKYHVRYRGVFEQYNFRFDSDSIKNIIDSASPDVVLFAGAYDESVYEQSGRKESMYFMSGLVNLLMASRMMGVPRFVYISSNEVFGNSYLSDIDEQTEPSPASNNGIIIAQGEKLVRNYGETSRMDTVILRVDNLYWIPGKRSDVRELHARMCLSALAKKEIPASAKKIFSSTYISDAVFSIYEIVKAENHKQVIYHITSGEEEVETEVAKLIKENADFAIIKDNTVGLTKRIVLSGKLAQEEFGLSIKYSYTTQVPAILDYMKKHERLFLKDEEREHGFWSALWHRLKKAIRILAPYIENFIVFILVFMLNNRTAGSQYFQRLDIFLLYVVLFAVFYGKKQAVISAVLSVGAYVFRQQYDRSGVDILIDINTYIWIAQFFIVGMSVGHLRDSLNMLSEDKDEQIGYLNDSLEDMSDINRSNLRVKNILEDHILDYDNTLGTLSGIVDRLENFGSEDTLIRATEVLQDLMGTKDVAIYRTSNADYARLMISATEQAGVFGKSMKYSSKTSMLEAFSRNEVYINRSLDPDMPILAAGLYEEGSLKYIIMVWNLAFEKISLHEIDMFKVVCHMIQNAIRRHDVYNDAVRSKRYIEGTSILNPDEFERLIEIGSKANSKDYLGFSLIQITGHVSGAGRGADARREELVELERRLLPSIRDTDYLGLGRDGRVYVLLYNSNAIESQTVVDRFRNKGVECRLKEG